MNTSDSNPPASWAPAACTLHTVEQPMRIAEFDRLFTDAVRAVYRPGPTRLTLELEPSAEVAARTAVLMANETACCSFFTFNLIATGGALRLEVSVPAGYVEVLDGLVARAAGYSSCRRHH